MKPHPLLIALFWLPAGLMPGARPATDGAPAAPVRPVAAAVVNFAELARQESARPRFAPGQVPRSNPEPMIEDEDNEPAEAVQAEPGAAAARISAPPRIPSAPAPGPALSFAGMDNIPKIGSGSTQFLSPDTNGAVGPGKLMTTLNNNYQIQDKTTGAALSSLSIDAFWSASGAGNGLDPKTLYDPVNNRWILTALTDFNTAASGIGIAVSLTSDPSGSYTLFRFDVDPADLMTADFPSIGFNMNWVAVSYGLFRISDGVYTGSKMMILDYPQLRAGTAGAVTVATALITSPAATYDPAEPVLYAPSNLSSASGTFRVNTITGSPAAPVFTFGAVKTHSQPWSDAGGAAIPQAPPLSGASACGATPCPIRAQDSNIRQTPVVRGGFLYFAQTVGLPAGGLTHVGVQWTKYDLAGGTMVDGRVEDPAATATNGGKWYDFPHLAVNQYGDILLGFSQYSSAQYASAGYSYHARTDGAAVMSAPYIIKAGADYYHRSSANGYNRWGDYSKAQVDPANDTDLWVIQEYAKPRVGTDDSTSLATNSSRWGTWWAKVAPLPPTETAPGDAGPVSGQRWPDKTTMTWAVNATAQGGYRLYRGTAADLPRLLSGAPSACLRFTGVDQNANSAAGQAEDPAAAGGLYWYLVVGVNPFGEGPAGDATAGPRIVNSSGACP